MIDPQVVTDCVEASEGLVLLVAATSAFFAGGLGLAIGKVWGHWRERKDQVIGAEVDELTSRIIQERPHVRN